MSDNKTKRGSDRSRISLSVNYRPKQLGVSREALAEVVKTVGNQTDAVHAHFRELDAKERA